MAWTQADVDALKAAIASGTLSVSYSDRSVTYRAMHEMQAALAMMQREVQGASAVNHRLASHSKGV